MAECTTLRIDQIHVKPTDKPHRVLFIS